MKSSRKVQLTEMYSPEPLHKKQYTENFDQIYGRFAKAYDASVKLFPLWRKWIRQAVPHILGPNVLEISFGTGYLLTQYATRFKSYGIDYNWKLTRVARRNLHKMGIQASLQQADVEHLPYRSETFDTVIETMAFTGYPDGQAAIEEIYRVIKQKGRFVLVDINYPYDCNWFGIGLTRLWARAGDIIRDMSKIFEQSGFNYIDKEVGGFGSVHLYVATKVA